MLHCLLTGFTGYKSEMLHICILLLEILGLECKVNGVFRSCVMVLLCHVFK